MGRRMAQRIAKFEKVSLIQFQEGIKDIFPHITSEETEEMYHNIELPKRATKGSAGYDFYLPTLNCVVDVKKYSSSGKISLSIIRTFIGVMIENNVDKGIIISSAEFTQSALNFVQNLEQEIVLLSLQDLLELDGIFASVFK